MQLLTLLMIVAVTTFDFFVEGDKWHRWAILPGWMKYLPELLSAAVLVYVVVAGARSRFRYVRPAYWLAFGAILVSIFCGVIANGVEAGPVFAGIRAYLRAIPWFLLPAAFAFSTPQIKVQLRLLLFIALLQVPFAVQQRMTTQEFGKITGDWTVGTMMLSPTLSIFLISALCIAAAFLVRKRLQGWQFGLLFLLFLLPVSINETKASLVLAPFGLLTAFTAAAEPRKRLRAAIMASAAVALFLTAFFPIYNYLNKEREYTAPLAEMLSDPAELERYLLYREGVGARGEVGKLDTVIVSLRIAVTDPTHLAFGHGIGNVSDSALGRGFIGRYYEVYGSFIRTSFGRIVLELGVLGLALVLTLMWLIYRDALVLARKDHGVRGALAAGLTGVVVVIVLAIPYTEMIAMDAVSFIFWYLAGLVAAERMRVPGGTAPAEG